MQFRKVPPLGKRRNNYNELEALMSRMQINEAYAIALEGNKPGNLRVAVFRIAEKLDRRFTFATEKDKLEVVIERIA